MTLHNHQSMAISYLNNVWSFVSVHSLRLSCRRSNTPWLCCVSAFSPSFPQAAKHETLTQRRAIVGPPSTTLSQHQAVLVYHIVFDATLNVGQRHRRRANINPALVPSIVTVTQARSIRPVLVQCWPTVCGAGSVLYRRWVDVYLLLLWWRWVLLLSRRDALA